MPRWPQMTEQERFLAKVEKTEACWIWKGGLKPNGYGWFSRTTNGKWNTRYAHRVAFELFKGSVTDGLYVCHRCDNRWCVNPDHLWLGTHQENQADMGRKGRTFSPARKLTDDDVSEIRRLIIQGVERKEIAAQFGVYPSHISRIKLGRRRSPSR